MTTACQVRDQIDLFEAERLQRMQIHRGLNRPEFEKALALCRVHNATLVVAKLDRLSRNTRFLLTLVEASGERGVVFCPRSPRAR